MTRYQMLELAMIGTLAALVAGCATTGYDRAGSMAADMQQTQADILGARSQVTATFEALETVMRAQVGDLRPLVNLFSRELAALEKSGDRARWQAQNIRTSGSKYFTAWAQEIETIQDAGLRASSLDRRDQTFADYREVERSLIAVGKAYDPLVKKLRDIETVLEQDLTASGLTAVQAPHLAARQDAVKLQTSMTSTLNIIDKVVARLAPVGTR